MAVVAVIAWLLFVACVIALPWVLFLGARDRTRKLEVRVERLERTLILKDRSD